MTDDLWVSVEHPQSGRCAVVAGEGDSVWLYLTGPEGDGIQADCWLWNRGPAMTGAAWQARAEAARGRGGPPPAPQEVLRPEALAGGPAEPPALRFAWTSEGDGVAVWVDGVLGGVVRAGDRRGASAGIARECPWGHPLADAPLDWAVDESLPEA